MEEYEYEHDHEYVVNGSELTRIQAVITALHIGKTISYNEQHAMAHALSDVMDNFIDLTVAEGQN